MNKVVLVTGASSGIGQAIARHLVKKGFQVYGTTRNPQPPQAEWKFVTMDVRNPESVKNAVQQIIATENKIDAVINNAGFGIAGALECFTEEEVRQQMETNFFGTVRVCQAVLPYMREKKNGSIINVSSVGGIMGLPFQGMYSASKFAIEGFSEALAQEVKPFGIHVSVIEPGDYHTRFTDNRIRSVGMANNLAYQDAFAKALASMEKDERSGSDPVRIGRLAAKILSKKKPSFRYLTGGLDQRFFAHVKPLLPASWYMWVLSMHYKSR